MCSCGPLHMANQKQDDQLEHSYSSYVMIRDVTSKTCRRRWMIGRCGERGSGISVLAARHDNGWWVTIFGFNFHVIPHILVGRTQFCLKRKYSRQRLLSKFSCVCMCVLWHINLCRLFNATFFYTYKIFDSCIYTHILPTASLQRGKNPSN